MRLDEEVRKLDFAIGIKVAIGVLPWHAEVAGENEEVRELDVSISVRIDFDKMRCNECSIHGRCRVEATSCSAESLIVDI